MRFKWLAGTLRAVFGKEVYVAPVLLTGKFISHSIGVSSILNVARKHGHEVLLEAFVADLSNVALARESGSERQKDAYRG